MKIMQSIAIFALGFIGLSALAGYDNEYETLCYISKGGNVLVKNTCQVNQIPQGDHHMTVINFDNTDYLLADEFTFTDEVLLEGYYDFFINGEVADRYLRDLHTFTVLDDIEVEADDPTMLCYKTSKLEICYD